MKVRFVDLGLASKIAAIEKTVHLALDEQVLKDSNRYVPYQDGDLHDSALAASNIGKGEIIWDTPYARRRYYEPASLSKTPNPQASTQWFEVAKSRHLDDWIRVAQATLK